MYFFSLCVCVSLSLSLSLLYIYIYIYIYITKWFERVVKTNELSSTCMTHHYQCCVISYHHDNVKQRMISSMRMQHSTKERERWRSCVVTVHLHMHTKKEEEKGHNFHDSCHIYTLWSKQGWKSRIDSVRKCLSVN